MSISHIINRFWKTLSYYLKGIVQRFLGNDNVFLWCGAIAFKVLVTFVPLIILSLGIFGIFLQREDLVSGIQNFIETFMPAYRSEDIIQVIEAFSRGSNAITVIGSIGLLILAITLFTTLRMTIGNVFGHQHTRRTILHGYASDVQMALLCSVLFLLSIGLTVFLRYMSVAGIEWMHSTSMDTAWLEAGWVKLIRTLGYSLPFLISMTLFFLLYYFIPNPRPQRSSALIGAVVTGVLWEVAKNGFALYATRLGNFDRYAQFASSGEGVSQALGDFFGLMIALVVWVYYSGLVLIVGAMVTAIREQRIMPVHSVDDPVHTTQWMRPALSENGTSRPTISETTA